MKVEALNNERIKDFVDYCVKYRFEHDDSFLYDDDLEGFKADEENPTYLLLDQAGNIIGVTSLIIMPYLIDLKKGRFRIFHVADTSYEAYKLLYDAIIAHTDSLHHIDLFVPETKTQVREILTKLSFELYRYSWVLVRDAVDIPSPILPEGYVVRPFRKGVDEKAWATVRNAAFATLKGAETPTTEQKVAELTEESDYVEGGMRILWKGDIPVGVIRVSKEEEDGKLYSFVAPLAIMPEYHGRGLGRALLRDGLIFGKSAGRPYGMLCVNAENEKAAELYLKEGFTKLAVMVNYRKELK